MAPVVVDLTEDEPVVIDDAAVPAAFQYMSNRNDARLWPSAARSQDPTAPSTQPKPANSLGFFHPPRNPKPSPNAGNASGSPLTSNRTSVKHEAPSPSGSGVPRFRVHIRDRSPVAKDPQPLYVTLGKPPPSRPAATVSPPQPVQRPPAIVQQPPRLQTPRKENWTVEKIAGKLGSFVDNVAKDHARLLEFLLEEAEMRAPQARQLTEFDDFADMKSIATDHGADSDSDRDLMNVRFKVSHLAPPSRGARRPWSLNTANFS
jgi:hypothetical protein